MKTSYFFMTAASAIITLGMIIPLPIASSDDFSGRSQLYPPRPDLTRISLSLNDTFHQTSQNSTKDLHLRFFDANNNSTINNVTFFINATKDGKVLIHDLFYTSTGSMALRFSSGNDVEKWAVHGTNEPTLGGWMSKNDTLHITGPAFTEGTYHIHVEVLSLFYVNELVDQSNPPKFDSWWSVDDKGNISRYENLTAFSKSSMPSVKIKDKSPLEQFKSGVAALDVTCKEGTWLIFKTGNNFPACVKPDTAYVLIHRGWAKTVSQTSLSTMPTVISSCNTSYPESKVGAAVLYMQANSTGKICATYHNPGPPAQSDTRVFAAKDEQQQASEILINAYPDSVPTGNSTIVYTIKTGSHAGLYGISFFCGAVPFAVGYDNQSRIILDDFPWFYKSDVCLSQTNVFQITGLSGIQVKYVTVAHRD